MVGNVLCVIGRYVPVHSHINVLTLINSFIHSSSRPFHHSSTVQALRDKFVYFIVFHFIVYVIIYKGKRYIVCFMLL